MVKLPAILILTNHGSFQSLVQQPVFAFLPLRSYGFRFIIQADFDVPSSREDVDKDSAWNQWLRQEIGSLFVQAFDDFKVKQSSTRKIIES